MSFDALEEELVITGGLLSISLFEEKLMKNFMIIANKLRRLEAITDLESKTKIMEKQLKFLGMKVETIVEKLPKDAGSVTKGDVKLIAKEQFIQMLNSNEEKVTKSKFQTDILNEIAKLREDIGSINPNFKASLSGKDSGFNMIERKQSKTSFTAGQVLLAEKEGKKISKQTLKEVLDQNQVNIVNGIIDEDLPEKEQNPIKQINDKIQDLYVKIEELRIGKGINFYAEREAEKFQKFQKYEQYEQKSRQTARKNRQKPIQLQGIKKENIKGQFLKNELYSQIQKSQLVKEEMAKQEMMAKKTMYNNGGSKSQFKRSSNQVSQFRKAIDNKMELLNDDQLKRAKSIKKLDRIERKLKLDDIKDINIVLREIQLRIQAKISNQIFMGFIKDIEEKLEILRITKDSTSEINEIRKNIYVMESKLQSIITYLQNSVGEDDALLVKKQWTCISCDKNLQKFNGKVGQHLNWDGISSKKISPTKAGAFGQTGQLASKIRNLMQNKEGQE